MLISLDNVSKTYGETKALDNLTFVAEPGEVLALLGPNGAGKTTAIGILSTLIAFDSGAASVAGFNVSTEGARVRQCIGLAGQNAAVDELLTARENLDMFGRFYRIRGNRLKSRIEDLLEHFGLSTIADRPANTYSGGQRRRLDIAVSIVAAPPILFMDEPTTGLDPRSRNSVWDLIRQFRDLGTTVLLTTQYLEEADQLADKIVMLNKGQIAAEGTVDQLKDRLGNVVVELTLDTEENAAKSTSLGTELGYSAEQNGANGSRSIRLSTQSNDDSPMKLLRKLDDAGLSPELFQVRRPTLDEVFLALTDDEGRN